MPVLWGIFGLGPSEMLVLGILCIGPLLVSGLVIFIVLLATRRKGDGEND